MAKRKVRAKRTWTTQRFIRDTLRTQIVRGHYPPESRVPTRDEMEKHFRASRITIQRAIDDLIREGFIRPRGRLGTFVTVTPPHLFDFILVLPPRTSSSVEELDYYSALEKQAAHINYEGPQRIHLFRGLNTPRDITAFQQLADDVLHHRRAGLIFADDPERYCDSPLLEASFPRVAIGPGPFPKGLPRVTLERDLFFELAIETLLKKKRKRIGLITAGPSWQEEQAGFLRACRAVKLQPRLHWVHHIPAGATAPPFQGVALMFDREDRPDALVVCDEWLTAPLLQTLKKAGRRPGRDVDLAVQRYFPWEGRQKAGVLRVGFDLPVLFKACFSILGAQRFHQAFPAVTRIKPHLPLAQRAHRAKRTPPPKEASR